MIVVVTKETPLRAYTRRRDARILRLLRQRDPTVTPLARANAAHEATVVEVKAALKKLGVLRDSTFTQDPALAQRASLVITVGGDGTLLRTSHHVGPDVPVLGINSAPGHSVGFFCGAMKGRVLGALKKAIAGELDQVVLARMHVQKNGTLVENRVLNEILFCHENPAATSRYSIEVSESAGARVDRKESHRSSGVWVGPAAGSTAAQRSAGGRVLPLQSRRLQWVVREPYLPRGKEPLALPKGLVPEDGHLTLVSRMHDARLFVDGHHRAYPVLFGERVVMRVSEEPLIVLGIHR